jgi:hypothetical protein
VVQSIVDPEQQRHFAANLRARALTMAELALTLNSHFRSLENTWRDSEYVDFEEHLEDATRKLKRFVEAADLYCNFLIRKAEAGDEYRRRRV